MSNSVYIEIVFQKNKPKNANAVRCFRLEFRVISLLPQFLFDVLFGVLFCHPIIRTFRENGFNKKRRKTPKICMRTL